MAVTLGAVAEYLVQSTYPEAKITDIGDAFWWAIVTVTTVGYGDLYPVTPGGKIVASMMMIIGIAILGILISIYTWSWTYRIKVQERGQKEDY